jgi:Flp pilus assembly protein TadG
MRKSEAGMALVEFAIVVPLLALLLVGLIEIGRFAYYSIVVGNAANAGAQYGAQNQQMAGQFTSIQNFAKADGQNNISNISATASNVCSCWVESTGTESPAPPTVANCTQNCASGIKVTYVQVQTSGSFPKMFNYPMFPANFSVSATAMMRVRQ